ncbi:gluconate 2-dehydrogenase subunit 3 family protein [Pseudonocardia kunmingensis]|uniref:Gluconate 2-dehydrogenase gamma chain n=1 Tax=Pseudonocardia kunmingensis TaxID=630975 RepID=A0A543DVG9_9PSEU|nr:gluconate 2-dehydrogenase subunit 3 family protein [Pseudonocardia kunmingensis]TQM13321.1 gluconate 2-dehydrogenase gamma chain [Pseudonocardia kunmingensis]
MTLKADWEIVGSPIDPDSDERLFFTQHEWDTIEAAAARIVPSDHDPGAREARVVVFIDRYLSGIDYIFAAADGSGFLKLTGKFADAWRARMYDMQRTYREGITALDAVAQEQFSKPFTDLAEAEQDLVLEAYSGAPKPSPVTLGASLAVGTFLQGTFDQGLPFFEALCLHVRQGFYCDPVYGGNKDRMGWKVIGFPGPESLKHTMDGTYSTSQYFVESYDWADLVPHLRAGR